MWCTIIVIVHVLHILQFFSVEVYLSVTVFPTSYLIIEIEPFNQFTLKCKASARVEDQSLPLPISLVWTRQQDRL